MDNKARAAALRQQIEAAFADVPYPIDDENGLGWADGERLQRDFRGRHWRDIPDDLLHEHQHDLPYYTLAGFHFFLPAYLLGSIQGHEEWDLESCTIFSLTLPEARHPQLIEWFLVRMGQMNAAQASAITEFLCFKRDTYEYDIDIEAVQRALDAYWEPRAMGRQISTEETCTAERRRRS